MPKNQVGAFVFMLIVTGLLNLLFSYLFLFLCFDLLFVCKMSLFFLVFLLLIGILLLRPYESIETSDSY